MSIDSQRLDIEHLRRLLADWLVRQDDVEQRVGVSIDRWFAPARRQHALDAQAFAKLLRDSASLAPLHGLMLEQSFGLRDRGESWIERYGRDSARTRDAVRDSYLQGLADSVPALWCVVEAGPGARLKIAPHTGGDVLTVHDRALAARLQPLDVLLARVIDMPAGPVLGEVTIPVEGVDPKTLPAGSAGVIQALSLLIARALRAEATDPGSPDERPGQDRAQRPEPSRDGGRHQPADKDRARLLDRVRKLFAMAQESEASPHEAEIALRRCQSLMKKYGISEADLETSAFANAELNTGRSVPMHVKYLAAAVARLHDVLFVTGSGGFAEFRGFEVDANVARLTLEYLLGEVERALTARKRHGTFPAGRSAAYDYRVGFAIEVDRRVVALTAERDREQSAAAGSTGTALAIRKRKIVERECGQDLRSSSFRGRGARDATARAAGHDDGARVSLDRQVEAEPSRPTLPSH